MKRWMAVMIAVTLAIACGRGGVTDATAPGALTEWSPYLGIHPFAWDQNIQQPYLAPLLERSMVRGIRLDASPETGQIAAWALGMGADDILGIFPNEYLAEPDVAEIFSATVRANPAIEYWEIGNEVDLFITMPPEQYVPIFIGLYRHAQAHHPEITVIPQASVGGTGGDSYIRRVLDAGLLGLARDPDPATQLRIFALHYYSVQSTYLPEAKRQIQRLPANVEVWVTEAGINGFGGQVDFVRTEYPRLRSMVRATRIYWYVFAECSGHSMVRGLPPTCLEDPPAPSPLYQLLLPGGGA
ncbi:MAG TPA: hypothetical protein VJ553_03955 [Candidatus Paceibacterota bacterium]|nr:hypothetical protein [Candidatus Paceibacterota bacterium]